MCNRFRQAIALAMVFVLLSNGCIAYRWRAVPLTEVSLAKAKLAAREVRIVMDAGAVRMKLQRLEFPYVLGRAGESDGGIVEVDLDKVGRIEIVELDGRGRVTDATLVPRAEIDRDPDQLLKKSVRLHAGEEEVVLRSVAQVRLPFVEGALESGSGPIRVDLRRARVMEVREIDKTGTTVRVIAITSAIVAATFVIALLTKESCPIVYQARGDEWKLVGEAYAGAAFRSIQRDDLLPLVDIPGAKQVRIRLRNEARETQYTDEARLVLVEHSPEVRALSTFDSRVVLVSGAQVPVKADDPAGDQAHLLAERDDRLWQTTPEQLPLAQDLEDVITAEFRCDATQRPVLELVAGNTPWLDLVFGRFFAAMGGRLGELLEKGNDDSAGPSLRRWREREGVDLIVEAQVENRWVRVAVVPTVGPAALREIAVPLPPEAVGRDGLLKVRLRSGLGFWRIDRLSLSQEVEVQATVYEAAPSTAVSPGRQHETAALESTDGHYNTLVEWGETLEMRFDLPPLAPGLKRSAFLLTNGYYNVHLPLQSRFEPGVLKEIRDEPGAFARFGRDLARAYLAAQEAAPPLGATPVERRP